MPNLPTVTNLNLYNYPERSTNISILSRNYIHMQIISRNSTLLHSKQLTTVKFLRRNLSGSGLDPSISIVSPARTHGLEGGERWPRSTRHARRQRDRKRSFRDPRSNERPTGRAEPCHGVALDYRSLLPIPTNKQWFSFDLVPTSDFRHTVATFPSISRNLPIRDPCRVYSLKRRVREWCFRCSRTYENDGKQTWQVEFSCLLLRCGFTAENDKTLSRSKMQNVIGTLTFPFFCSSSFMYRIDNQVIADFVIGW